MIIIVIYGVFTNRCYLVEVSNSPWILYVYFPVKFYIYKIFISYRELVLVKETIYECLVHKLGDVLKRELSIVRVPSY